MQMQDLRQLVTPERLAYGKSVTNIAEEKNQENPENGAGAAGLRKT
jgi:hypothetical protein